MSVADNIQALADLCGTAAHELLDAMIGLGPRTADPDPAAHAWDQTRASLQGQMDQLTALATQLSSEAVLAALAAQQDAIDRLAGVTDRAETEIKRIQDASKLLSTAARILDVGLAVLTLASAPSVASVKALIGDIRALSDALP
jgi:hypothetical protein